MATMTSVLVALCEALRGKTKVDVFLGRPDDAVPGVYLWPWGLYENSSLNDLPRPPESGADRSRNAVVPPILRVIVLVRPALTLDGLTRLGEVRELLLEMPILNVDGSAVSVVINPMDVDQLSKLFSAASLSLSICLSAELRWTE
jgi:hypothetical protein